MTRKLFHWGLLAVVVLAGVTSYGVRRHLCGGQSMDCARRWLTLSNSQYHSVRNEDPNFEQDAQVLSQSLEQARQALVRLIAASQTPSQAIQSQSEVVLKAHHALMRRTVSHLLVMRELVDTSQCVRLNDLCSSVMYGSDTRGGMGRARLGRGQGMGRGMHRWRRGQNALAPALSLTETQQEAITRIDPDYVADVSVLTEQVRTTHQALAQVLQDVNSPDETVHQVLDEFIEAQTALEQRTVAYVLSLRSLLTSDQQQRLIGLSQSQIQTKGRRWRGGR